MAAISVIVPVYKVEPFLRRCVDSILGQSFRDFDLVLVDDGSPDSCPRICDEYEDRDPRVHVIHQKNGGLSAARNTGIQWALDCSDSQWLTFVDSDDWIHRDFLELLLHSAVTEHVDLAVGDFQRIADYAPDPELRDVAVQVLDAESAYVNFYAQCMTAWGKLFRKGLFAQLRFPVGKLNEDCYITHILTFEAGKAAMVPVPLYYYYCNPEGIMRSRWNPRKLDEIRAHELRLTYFQVRGLEKAWKRELEVYIMTLYEHASALGMLEDKKYSAHLKAILKKLRQARREGRKQDLCPIGREYFWLHLMALTGPRFWLLCQKANGVRHDLRKG